MHHHRHHHGGRIDRPLSGEVLLMLRHAPRRLVLESLTLTAPLGTHIVALGSLKNYTR